MTKIAQRLVIPCTHCGRTAAEMALLPGAVKGEGLWTDRDRLERTGFMGSILKFGEWPTLTAWFATLAQQDYAAFDDMDFVGFYCRPCQRVYCDQCWQIGPPVFDEGFYDYTDGECPVGHSQIVDD